MSGRPIRFGRLAALAYAAVDSAMDSPKSLPRAGPWRELSAEVVRLIDAGVDFDTMLEREQIVMSEQRETFEGWMVVEMMGHRRLVGRVAEHEMGGTVLLRVEVPGSPDGRVGPTTCFVHPQALYQITPTTEDIARQMAAEKMPDPIRPWDLPPATRRAIERYEEEEYAKRRAIAAEANGDDDPPFDPEFDDVDDDGPDL